MASKTPMRKCVACQEKKAKKELIRIVNHPEQGVMIDRTGKANGRGAYLCRKEECIRLAQKKNILKAALKTSFDSEFYEEIVHDVSE